MPKKAKINVKERIEDNTCDLSLSELREIPVREIASFKRVTILDLSSNKLLTLGKNFTTLTRLVKLDLSKNQIKYLPEDFGLLRNLRHLDLYDNKLEHLPLSFGDLVNLRYLDLKGNPLTPALAKIVGLCLTTKECQDSARRTVKFLSSMQLEAIRAKEQFRQEMLQNQVDSNVLTDGNINTEDKTQEQQKPKKSNKKSKSKQKKSLSDVDAAKEVQTTDTNIGNTKSGKSKRALKSSTTSLFTSGGSAMWSLLIFLLLLGFNIVLIYLIMFKNPEIADKLAELIPHQYRDWIVSRTEIFRLSVTDWISKFRTPPEEH